MILAHRRRLLTKMRLDRLTPAPYTNQPFTSFTWYIYRANGSMD